MIVPKRKTSKQRKRLRKSQDRLVFPNNPRCSSCQRARLAHSVCSYCGFYKNRKVKNFTSQQDRIEA